MGFFDEECENFESMQALEDGCAEIFVRRGWSAKFRGVRISRLQTDGATYLIVPVQAEIDNAQWQLITFEANSSTVRLLAPNSVIVRNRTGQTPEIERRPSAQ